MRIRICIIEIKYWGKQEGSQESWGKLVNYPSISSRYWDLSKMSRYPSPIFTENEPFQTCLQVVLSKIPELMMNAKQWFLKLKCLFLSVGANCITNLRRKTCMVSKWKCIDYKLFINCCLFPFIIPYWDFFHRF